jgi:hypothetical protein
MLCWKRNSGEEDCRQKLHYLGLHFNIKIFKRRIHPQKRPVKWLVLCQKNGSDSQIIGKQFSFPHPASFLMFTGCSCLRTEHEIDHSSLNPRSCAGDKFFIYLMPWRPVVGMHIRLCILELGSKEHELIASRSTHLYSWRKYWRFPGVEVGVILLSTGQRRRTILLRTGNKPWLSSLHPVVLLSPRIIHSFNCFF